MSLSFKPTAWTAIVFLCMTAIASIAWQQAPASGTRGYRQDTIPSKEHTDKGTVINGDLNKALEDVKKAQEHLAREQNQDWDKMHKDLLKAQAELSAQDIHAQVEKALKDIDLQKIQMETQSALQQVNWEKMQQDMQRAQNELKNNLDSKKMQADIQRALEATRKAMAELKSVDMEKMQHQLEQSRKDLALNEGHMREDIERAKKEVAENLHLDMKKDLEKAAEDVARAAAELQDYKDMLDEMDRDGLLHSKESYNIEYKKGELFIDGKQQPENITDKYKHYFKKDHVRLKRQKGDDNKTIDL